MNKKILCFLIILTFISLSILLFTQGSSPKRVMGGWTHSSRKQDFKNVQSVSNQKKDYSEMYQRPSCKKPVPNQYTFKGFSGPTPLKIETQKEVVKAYYGILKEASNMIGYAGGCGSVGDGAVPYPYAYNLMTTRYKESTSLKEFIASFSGIGHITLLELYPLESSPDANYNMIEIEVITGPKQSNSNQNFRYDDQLSYFAYYYGIVTTTKEKEEWRIDQIDYLPEEFLCAPYHSWFYDAEMVVPIIYIENLKIVDKVVNTTQVGSMVYVFAEGNDNAYRFDFVKLTNGHDILVEENELKNGRWVPVSLLTDPWKEFKFSIKSFDSN